jgi:hypothetical protein
MYDEFRKGLTHRLWDTRDELVTYTSNNIDEILKDERGTNEMSMGKATGFLILFEKINEMLFKEMQLWLKELDLLNSDNESYLDNMRRFSQLRKQNLMDCNQTSVEEFNYDVEAIFNHQFTLHPSEVRLETPKKFKIHHLIDQKDKINSYIKEFGQSHDGLGKMLMRYPHIHKIFRRPEAISMR